MSKTDLFPMPEPKAAVVNGDAVLQFRQPDGEVVGEFNFSKILRNWWNTATGQKSQAIEVVK